MATADELIKRRAGRGWASRSSTRATSSAPCAPGAPRRRSSTASTSTTTARRRRCKQLATINVPEPRMLTVQPFDPSSIKAIEKAIQESDLGLTPSNDGKLIRLPIPQLTEERRKELVKVVRNMAEEHRVAVREIRRDAMKHLKELVDNGEVGADEEHRAEEPRPEADRRAHEADRRAAEAQGSRGHGGLSGLRPRHRHRRQPRGAPSRGRARGRDHHGRQRALGDRARRLGRRRPPRGLARAAAGRRGGDRPRHRVARRLRVLDRELEPRSPTRSAR